MRDPEELLVKALNPIEELTHRRLLIERKSRPKADEIKAAEGRERPSDATPAERLRSGGAPMYTAGASKTSDSSSHLAPPSAVPVTPLNRDQLAANDAQP